MDKKYREILQVGEELYMKKDFNIPQLLNRAQVRDETMFPTTKSSSPPRDLTFWIL